MPTQSNISKDLFLLHTLEDHQNAIIDCLNKGRHNIFIYSRELNHKLFDNDTVIDFVSSIARKGATAEVRILINNPQALVDHDHRLLRLAQRLSSKIHIQSLTIEPPDNQAFMIVDDNKLWLQHNENETTGANSGFVNFSARVEVKKCMDKFRQWWRYSESDIRLKQLNL